jgi:hypothetical protein
VRKTLILVSLAMLFAASAIYAQKPKKQMYTPNAPVPDKYKVDTRIDNMSYWRRMASLGLVPVAPDYPAPYGNYTGSKLTGKSVLTDDSPDIPVTTVNSTQSENSIFVDPNNSSSVLNSNNSTPRPASGVYGANDFWSTDAGNTWGGHVQGAGGENSGDPATAIGLNGWYYVGYIHSSGGQGVSYSTNQGNTWTPVLAAPAPSGFSALLDKNHMWIDNSISSPHEGNLYDAWTNFGGSNDAEIEIIRSTNQGLTWSAPVNISSAVNAGSHNQGVNLQTGPNGEVYAIWAIYDGWPTDETAIGMARSFDGGATYQPATRIISNIRGIRNSGTGKNMRVNAFPTMTVDISNGPNRGTIYVVWPNIGVPGTNTGSDMDIYMIKSADLGITWSTPLKVNQDASGLGKKHYFPWITSDATNGNLSVIYYDDRNVSSTQCEVYVSNSSDGGVTWEDLKVSDVSFTPQPISGLATGYFGDYLGIHAHDRWVYPVWTDNRQGFAMTYVSPFQTGPPPNQPWVIYQSHLVNDAIGNNNGLLDYGESLHLNITLENIGDQPATAVNSTLSTDSPFITISDATELFGDFEVGEVKTLTSAFALNVSAAIPDGEIISFTITSVDDVDSTFISNFNIEAHAPALQAGALSINDATGNGNGRFDPGETATVTIITSNPGDYVANAASGQLTTSSPFVSITNSVAELGNIEPGILNAVGAQFDITVDPLTPIGHSVSFNYTATSGLITINKTFNTPVGLILEDWETGGYESFEWEFAGTAPWAIATDQVYEGTYSTASGSIGDNRTSEMKITYNVMGNDTISFYIKVSSESSYDFLNFYIGSTMRGQWSGEVDWQQVKFAVAPGSQTFRWVYSKDGSVVSGSDKAWVDFIVFPAPLQTTAFAGADAFACGSDAFLLNGTATNYVSVLWSTSGDGNFEDATQLSTFYTPGANDLSTGNAILTLTVNGPEGQIMADNMTLSFNTPAIVSAGAAASICSGTDLALNGVGENYVSVNWLTSGDGAFSDPNILNPVYTPGTTDIENGGTVLTLVGISAIPCTDAISELTVTLLPAPVATLNGDTLVCAGSPVPVTLQLTGTAPWTIEMDGAGTLLATDTPHIFSVSPVNSQLYQIISVVDGNNCAGSGEGSFMVNVNPLPELYLVSDTIACINHVVALTAETEGEVNYLWTPGNFISQSINVDTTGIGSGTHTWTVSVTDVNNCISEASVNVTFNECTGIAEMGKSNMDIYPNPSQGNFTLRFAQSPAKLVSLTISDASGKEVYSLENAVITENEIRFSNTGLTSGVYLIKVSEDNKIITTRLIIK